MPRGLHTHAIVMCARVRLSRRLGDALVCTPLLFSHSCTTRGCVVHVDVHTWACGALRARAWGKVLHACERELVRLLPSRWITSRQLVPAAHQWMVTRENTHKPTRVQARSSVIGTSHSLTT
jgi:hypothetical protein